jgi:hypothetical protein
MPLELPNLDDRTYNDLVQEALSLIPTYAPNWTDYNPADPGITLIELFAYLTEMLIYRLNLVTDENKTKFLKLLNGSEWELSREKTLNEEIRDVILALRKAERAVTCEDFEQLVLAVNQKLSADELKVARAKCLPRRNLKAEISLNRTERPGHISIIIVPEYPVEPNGELITNLINKIADELDKRRLLTTRVHVVEPRYLNIGVHLIIHIRRDVRKSSTNNQNVIENLIKNALIKFLDPLKGGTNGKGWPFGRDIYVSEIYQLLDGLPEVDYVEKADNQDELTVEDPLRRIPEDINQPLIAIKLLPEELVKLNANDIFITIESPVES